jgi:hypothetical protein
VNVTTYLVGAVAGLSGMLTVAPQWSPAGAVTVPVTLGAAGQEVSAQVSFAVPAGAVALWWPAGLSSSARPMYALNVSFQPAAGGLPVVAAPRRIGFRSLALVTADDSSPSALAGQVGSGNLTMRLRVNGASLFLRGANWIPLDLEGRVTDAAYAAALASAAAANMNSLRVWGGGIWPSEALLQAADELGLLLYVDAMYASQSDSHHFADASDAQQATELRYHARRMASHPALALLDACNECSGGVPFNTFVAPILAEEDPSRPIWPASPSAGWSSGVDRLWGLPDGSALTVPPSPQQPLGPVPGCANCTQQGGAFAYGFPVSSFLTPLPVADAAACCALCSATAGCQLANYQARGCQLVAPPFAVAQRDQSSLVLYPAGGAQPVPVPLANSVEKHGPYYGGGGWVREAGGPGRELAACACSPLTFSPSPSSLSLSLFLCCCCVRSLRPPPSSAAHSQWPQLPSRGLCSRAATSAGALQCSARRSAWHSAWHLHQRVWSWAASLV